ncbi:MAG TPA: hypothetical protein VFP46_02320, partial [Candidatus Paceibacterota bacterium]|nr:hypothetical protein [Candidatus Paceibacterota bacterium]
MQKFNRFLAPVIVGWTALLPIAVAAQTVTDSNLKFYKDLIVSTINGVIMPVLLAIALLLFFWGVFKYYIKGGDDESERSKGHQFILWAIIGFAVIIS